MSKFIDSLSQDLLALGKLGGAELEKAVSRLLPTLEPVLRTRLQEVLVEVAKELKEQIPGGRIEARINGEAFEFLYIQDETNSREIPSELNARITLRLPDDLKYPQLLRLFLCVISDRPVTEG